MPSGWDTHVSPSNIALDMGSWYVMWKRRHADKNRRDF